MDFYFIQLSEIQFIFSPSFGTGRVKYKYKNIPDFFNPFFATRIFLHPPENNKKPEVSFSFLMVSGGIERNQSHEMVKASP